MAGESEARAVDARGARGIQCGSGNTQKNYYGNPSHEVKWPLLAVPPPQMGDVPRADLVCRIRDRLAALSSNVSVIGTSRGRMANVVPGEPTTLVAALAGAAGFGKTTLARMLVHDRTVQESFPDGIVWVTLG